MMQSPGFYRDDNDETKVAKEDDRRISAFTSNRG